MGGMTLSNATVPLDVIQLPVLEDIIAIVVHPHFDLPTVQARAALPKEIPLNLAVKQWRNVAAFITAVYEKKYQRLGNYMEDFIIEPARQHLIPGFLDVKKAAIENGAIFCSISGGGPSVFAFSVDSQNASAIGLAMKHAFQKNNIGSDVFISRINTIGAKLVKDEDAIY